VDGVTAQVLANSGAGATNRQSAAVGGTNNAVLQNLGNGAANAVNTQQGSVSSTDSTVAQLLAVSPTATSSTNTQRGRIVGSTNTGINQILLGFAAGVDNSQDAESVDDVNQQITQFLISAGGPLTQQDVDFLDERGILDDIDVRELSHASYII
jgi:hypothetical protein